MDAEHLLGGLGWSEVLGHEAGGPVTVAEEPYPFGSPATGALLQVRGPDWAAFVKVLQHVRHWPVLPLLPPEAAEAFVAMFPWREELALWAEPFASALPAGLRTPHLHRVVELGDDRAAVWMESVEVDPSPWHEARFARAATLLAQLNAALATPEAIASTGFPPGYALEQWVRFGLGPRGLRPLDDDGVWSSPALAAHADLREDLRRAGDRVPDVLRRLAALPQGRPHGDASPQNLLVPQDGSAEFVVIDLSFQTPAPLGSDLAQLVVGLAHAGQLPPERLPAVEETGLSAYAAASPASAGEVAAAYAGTLLLRSGLTAIPYDRPDAPELPARVALTRFVLGAAERHLT